MRWLYFVGLVLGIAAPALAQYQYPAPPLTAVRCLAASESVQPKSNSISSRAVVARI